MAVIRLILLVSVLGGLTLLLVQNWSPVLPLVFLGMRTQPLPLALLILFSTAAGAFTSISITTLLKLSNLFAGQQQKTPAKSATPPRQTTPRRETTPSPTSQSPPASKTEKTTDNTFDDWDSNGTVDDDWDVEAQPETAGSGKTYERQQTPKSGSQSGSVYSYSYREPKNTAVGKTESVYDADYRVIIPPYQPPTTNQADDDDWDFFEDDEFEDEDKPSRR